MESLREEKPEKSISFPPRLTRRFILQAAALGLAGLAASFPSCTFSRQGKVGENLWVLVDRSASMSASEDGVPRIELAKRKLKEILTALDAKGSQCFRLSVFDLVLEHRLPQADSAQLQREIALVRPRALGTDLALIANWVQGPKDRFPQGCRVDGWLVLTDQPAPEWVSGQPVTWLDIASATSNVGFVDFTGERDALTGGVRAVLWRVQAFGTTARAIRLTLHDPDGQLLVDQEWLPSSDASWSGRIDTPRPGRYRFKISPGGSYLWDDNAEVEVADWSQIRVDWRLDDASLPRRLNWTEDRAQPQLRVTAWTVQPVWSEPTLLVGAGIEPGRTDTAVQAFRETSPLLDDLNLDVAETLRFPRFDPPRGFVPALRGGDNVWLAQRLDPPAAYVPGLPGGDDNLGRFATTAFFNGVRWLLSQRLNPPLYELTTPDRPYPEGIRLALHPNEGNTALTPRSSIAKPQTGSKTSFWQRAWPILLVFACVFRMAERLLSVFGGDAWS